MQRSSGPDVKEVGTKKTFKKGYWERGNGERTGCSEEKYVDRTRDQGNP